MKQITFLLLLIAQMSFGQSKSLMKTVDRIDYQTDTLQAVFDWVADNISYDLAKFKKIQNGVNFYQKGNYKSAKAYKADMLEKVIKRKKGVCDDYTLLFHSIVSELGYTAHIVEGITKEKGGKIRRGVGHSWNAVLVDGEWKLYDPTWGAGYVNNKMKFVKKYHPQWYDVDPEEMKETHMPFDPIWQISENPMTFDEFRTGTQGKNLEANMDYKAVIAEYLGKDEEQQKIDALRRSEENGGNTKPIKKYRKHLKEKINYLELSGNAYVIQSTVEKCNDSSKRFGEYIDAKNNRFKRKPWTIDYAINELQEIKEDIGQSIETFKSVKVKDRASKKALKSFISQSKSLQKKLEKELEFLNSKT